MGSHNQTSEVSTVCIGAQEHLSRSGSCTVLWPARFSQVHHSEKQLLLEVKGHVISFHCYLTNYTLWFKQKKSLTLIQIFWGLGIHKRLEYSKAGSCNLLSVYARQLMLVVRYKASFQSLSHVWLFATPWTTARQASLSITNSWSLLKLMSIESVMPSNHLLLCLPLLLLPSIFPSISVF